MENDNSTKVLTKFVAGLNIPVTRQGISQQLEKHPDYDSMLAFSEVLDFYKVPNVAYRLKADQLVDVRVPFIAHLTQRRFGVVTAYDDKYVKLSDEKGSKTLPLADFNKSYGGTVLVAEKDENSGEAGYAEKRQKERIERLRLPVAVGGLALLFILLIARHTGFIAALNISLALLTLFKTAGLAIAVMLLMQSINANNPLIQKLCGGDNGKDCNAILSSKAAKVNAYLTWSEVGFFYFAGTWLVLLFTGGQTPVVQTLAILNLLCLPYTVYSIYYQWRVAKQWCVFCCAVQALLWLEFFAFLPYVQNIHLPNLKESENLLLGLASPMITWTLIKPYLLQAQQIWPLKQQLYKFKYDRELFNSLLKKERCYQLPEVEWSLTNGAGKAKNVIVMITNPHCKYCIKAHQNFKELLDARTDLQARIVFTDVAERNHEHGYSVIRHVMSLNIIEGYAKAEDALTLWYTRSIKYLEWINIFPVTITEDSITKAAKQADWCNSNGLNATPEFLVNGYRLPRMYDINDLKYLLD